RSASRPKSAAQSNATATPPPRRNAPDLRCYRFRWGTWGYGAVGGVRVSSRCDEARFASFILPRRVSWSRTTRAILGVSASLDQTRAFGAVDEPTTLWWRTRRPRRSRP